MLRYTGEQGKEVWKGQRQEVKHKNTWGGNIQNKTGNNQSTASC